MKSVRCLEATLIGIFAALVGWALIEPFAVNANQSNPVRSPDYLR